MRCGRKKEEKIEGKSAVQVMYLWFTQLGRLYLFANVFTNRAVKKCYTEESRDCFRKQENFDWSVILILLS